jgi:ribosome assembly protein YihI (activator of Der GTPase)
MIMFEQDYVMRLIKEMVRAILKLLFNIDTESPTVELIENKEEKETLENLLDMVDAGKINEAENRLYDIISATDMDSLKVALLFYSYLNDKTDDFLEANDFSRDEIKLGMENIADCFGLSSIAKMFLKDF